MIALINEINGKLHIEFGFRYAKKTEDDKTPVRMLFAFPHKIKAIIIKDLNTMSFGKTIEYEDNLLMSIEDNDGEMHLQPLDMIFVDHGISEKNIVKVRCENSDAIVHAGAPSYNIIYHSQTALVDPDLKRTIEQANNDKNNSSKN